MTTAILIILITTISTAHERDFTEAKSLIGNKTICSNLTDEQLESIGDYYMEQMHPGELHEVMDERMGGEGSEQLKQVHIAIGKSFYCGEEKAISQMNMNIMLGRTSFMNRMMFGNYYQTPTYLYLLQFILAILLIVALTILIIFLIKKLRATK